MIGWSPFKQSITVLFRPSFLSEQPCNFKATSDDRDGGRGTPARFCETKTHAIETYGVVLWWRPYCCGWYVQEWYFIVIHTDSYPRLFCYLWQTVTTSHGTSATLPSQLFSAKASVAPTAIEGRGWDMQLGISCFLECFTHPSSTESRGSSWWWWWWCPGNITQAAPLFKPWGVTNMSREAAEDP